MTHHGENMTKNANFEGYFVDFDNNGYMMDFQIYLQIVKNVA